MLHNLYAGRFLGGGVFAAFESVVRVHNSSLVGNVAESGGAVAVDGGTGWLTNSSFESNAAGADGAGLYMQLGSAKFAVTGCRFVANDAGQRGGAIAANQAPLLVQECTMDGNRATRRGGALWLYSPSDVVRVARGASA